MEIRARLLGGFWYEIQIVADNGTVFGTRVQSPLGISQAQILRYFNEHPKRWWIEIEAELIESRMLS